MIAACSNILPVFKVKNISQDLKIVARKQQMEKKKAKLQAQKEATKLFNSKSKKVDKKEELISELQGTNVAINNDVKPQDSQSLENTVKDSQVNLKGNAVFPEKIQEFLASDLSKIQNLEEFENALNSCSDVRKTKKGYPFVMKKPRTINKKVWKAYYKKLSKNI